MLRGLTCALGAAAVMVLAVLASPVAWAAPVDDAVAGLRDSAVFVHPQANRQVDVAALERAIGDAPIKIAVLPKKSPTEDYPVSEIRTWPRLVSEQLPGYTVATVSGRRFYAGSEVLCGGLAGQAASRAIYANESELDADENSDLTGMLTDFVAEVKAAQPCEGEPANRGDRYADEPGGGDTGEAAVVDDTATVLPWVIGAAALVLLAVGGWVLLTRRAAAKRAATDRAEARALVERLGAELADLPDGPATADAAGKHGEASTLLAGATTDVQFAAARHAAIEGLTAAGEARLAAGLGPGQPVPPFGQPAPGQPAVGQPVVGQPAVGQPGGGQPDALPHRPLPRYEPGSPHFHPGSAAVPAGWYPEPFWTAGQLPGGAAGDPFVHTPHHT